MKMLRSSRTGRVICYKCKKGYGSEYDGLCKECRGVSAHVQRVRDTFIVDFDEFKRKMQNDPEDAINGKVEEDIRG